MLRRPVIPLLRHLVAAGLVVVAGVGVGNAVRDRSGSVEPAPAPVFDIERMGGGRITSEDLIGRVTLVNFWASWCAPCRDELPALDSLRRAIDDTAFALVAISDDIDVAGAARMAEALALEAPVGFGRGAMRGIFHNQGVPFTVLFDRDGRQVRQWLGYGGPSHLTAVRRVVEEELRRGR